MTESGIFAEQKRLYTESYKKFAGSPKATMQVHLDYQNLRFQKILEQIDHEDLNKGLTLLDYACGQGDLLDYILMKKLPIEYYGIDINEHYISFAKNKFQDSTNIFFLQEAPFPLLTKKYDYICVSGMFHYKASASPQEWESLCKALIKILFSHVNKGLIFNCLSSEVDFMDRSLFYWNPVNISRYVQHSLSRYFRIDHAYPLYEWTMAVFTEDFMKSKFHQPTFNKYF